MARAVLRSVHLGSVRLRPALKKIKVDGRWVLRSIPKKANGNWDWGAVPDGRYFIEWYENGQRRREAAATTCRAGNKPIAVSAISWGHHACCGGVVTTACSLPSERSLEKQIEHYLSQTETLKKPNTHRKYEAVLNRFAKDFRGRTV